VKEGASCTIVYRGVAFALRLRCVCVASALTVASALLEEKKGLMFISLWCTESPVTSYARVSLLGLTLEPPFGKTMKIEKLKNALGHVGEFRSGSLKRIKQQLETWTSNQTRTNTTKHKQSSDKHRARGGPPSSAIFAVFNLCYNVFSMGDRGDAPGRTETPSPVFNLSG
jgi:hypothetical protein